MTAGDGEANRVGWSQDLEIGVPEIDADHRLLIDLIGQVETVAGGSEAIHVLGSLLDSLSDYVDYHFRREERMQEAVGYPGLDLHRSQHEVLRREVGDLLDHYRDRPQSIDPIELAGFLRRWLIKHITKQDMAYKPFVTGNPKAREAAASIGVEFFLEEPA